MHTNTSWQLVLWAAEFTKSTHWSRNWEHCCCHGLFGVANSRPKLWQNKVEGFPKHLLFCLYSLMWLLAICGCWALFHCVSTADFLHSEPNLWLALKWSGSRTDDICRSLPIEWLSSLHQRDVLSISTLLIWGMNHKRYHIPCSQHKGNQAITFDFHSSQKHWTSLLSLFMLLLSLHLNNSRFFCQKALKRRGMIKFS